MTAMPIARRLARWDVVVGLLVVLLFLFGDSFVASGGVRTSATAFITLQNVSEIMLVALPMTMLIISGEIDLSVGSMIGLSSCVIGKLYSHGLPMWVCALGGVATGLVGGAFNGWLVSKVGLQSLAVTIGTLGLYRGLCYVLLGDTSVAKFPKSWVQFGAFAKMWGWMPKVGFAMMIAIVVFVFILRWSKTGHQIYAIGLNNEAARYSGVKVAQTKFWLFVATGTMSGVAGVFWTLRHAGASPDSAQGWELQIIASVLFGGVSIFGGVGGLFGTINGVLFLGLSRTVLRLTDVKPNVLTIVTGGLLLASVVGPAVLARLRTARTTTHFSRPATVAAHESRSAQSPLPDPERL
ncbi:MAG TPA: ABC transporter permease [Acidothermaceae bacterium]